MFKYIIILCLAASSLLVLPQRIEADKVIIPPKPLSVKEHIVKYAQVYHVPEKMLLDVAKCESNYDPTAVGDHGKANGIFQFHKPTFDAFARELGEELDYNSSADQAKLAAWAFAQGKSYKRQWTCYSIMGYNK